MTWWKGMNFSIGSQAKQQQLEEDLNAAVELMSDVEDRTDLSQSDHDLYNRLEKALDEDHDLLEHQSTTISNFLLWWKGIWEDRNLTEMFEDAVETKSCMLNPGKCEYELMRYYPEKYNKKLPKAGGWIMVIREPGVAPENRPELFGTYYAKATPLKVPITISEFGRSRTRTYDYYKVKIQTETTELHLWPHEYVIVADINEVLAGVGTEFEMVKLGGDTNYDSAKVHYLATRGIGQTEVYQMLMGAINSTTFAYFKIIQPEVKEYYQFFFDCMEKGIRAEMVPRLWESMKTGKPLFKVKYIKRDKDGKEVEVDKAEFEKREDREETDSQTGEVDS